MLSASRRRPSLDGTVTRSACEASPRFAASALRRFHGARRGLAVAELAVCLPVITLVVFGSIQACNLIYLRQALTSAAYEGTMEVAKPNATNLSVAARVQQVLDARGVVESTIQIRPDGVAVATAPQGTPHTIVVSARVASNLSLAGFFPTPLSVHSSLAATR
ncbi:MAG: TadE family protein [Planctomycetota bacterium]